MLNILHITPYVDCVTETEIRRHDAEIYRCETELFAYGQTYIAKANGKYFLILDYDNFSNLVQCQDLKNGSDFFRNYSNGNYVCRCHGQKCSVDIELKEYKGNVLRLARQINHCSTVDEINILLCREWLS